MHGKAINSEFVSVGVGHIDEMFNSVLYERNTIYTNVMLFTKINNSK